MIRYTAIAKIKKAHLPDSDAWTEELDVASYDSAESDVKAIVKSFNDTLRPGEEPRSFVAIDFVKEEEFEETQFEDEDLNYDVYGEEDDID